jgi:hypothetical protein
VPQALESEYREGRRIFGVARDRRDGGGWDHNTGTREQHEPLHRPSYHRPSQRDPFVIDSPLLNLIDGDTVWRDQRNEFPTSGARVEKGYGAPLAHRPPMSD